MFRNAATSPGNVSQTVGSSFSSSLRPSRTASVMTLSTPGAKQSTVLRKRGFEEAMEPTRQDDTSGFLFDAREQYSQQNKRARTDFYSQLNIQNIDPKDRMEAQYLCSSTSPDPQLLEKWAVRLGMNPRMVTQDMVCQRLQSALQISHKKPSSTMQINESESMAAAAAIVPTTMPTVPTATKYDTLSFSRSPTSLKYASMYGMQHQQQQPTKMDTTLQKSSTAVPPLTLLDPITNAFMYTPVLTSSGIHYDLSSILEWAKTHHECYITKQPLLPFVYYDPHKQAEVYRFHAQHNIQPLKPYKKPDQTYFELRQPMVQFQSRIHEYCKNMNTRTSTSFY